MIIPRLKTLHAREILDSRGQPTVEVTAILTNNERASAAVPSGASTGKYEAHELRDGDPRRYAGRGVLTACRNVMEIIEPHLKGMRVDDQRSVDQRMVELDGTPNKHHLGANALLAVSLACARVAAQAQNLPLYAHLRQTFDVALNDWALPEPLLNVVNGGKHATNGLDFQEYHLITHAPRFTERLRIGAEIYQVLGTLMKERGLVTGVGDEGGYAPRFASNRAPLDLLVEAVARAGFTLGRDVSFGLDVAASTFVANDGQYSLTLDQKRVSSSQLIEWYSDVVKEFPLILLEDGLSEDDWNGWRLLTKRLPKLHLVGDDLLVTSVDRLQRAFKEQAANAILIKPNQVGTVSETMETIRLAVAHGYTTVIANRSGETNDPFIADLSVAVNAAFLKAGAPARSERLAKYNRLLAIEEETG